MRDPNFPVGSRKQGAPVGLERVAHILIKTCPLLGQCWPGDQHTIFTLFQLTVGSPPPPKLEQIFDKAFLSLTIPLQKFANLQNSQNIIISDNFRFLQKCTLPHKLRLDAIAGLATCQNQFFSNPPKFMMIVDGSNLLTHLRIDIKTTWNTMFCTS